MSVPCYHSPALSPKLSRTKRPRHQMLGDPEPPIECHPACRLAPIIHVAHGHEKQCSVEISKPQIEALVRIVRSSGRRRRREELGERAEEEAGEEEGLLGEGEGVEVGESAGEVEWGEEEEGEAAVLETEVGGEGGGEGGEVVGVEVDQGCHDCFP